MKSSSITRLIFDTIPQIYQAESGNFPVDLGITGEKSMLFSILPLSTDLETYLAKAAKIWDDLRPMTEGEMTQVIEREWIQQKFAVSWLEAKTGISTWNSILDYFHRLARRRIENQKIPKTLVIEPGEPVESKTPLTNEAYFKVFDWLGSTPVTYFRVNEKLDIKSLEAVSLTEVKDLKGYRFYPDRLHPIINSLRDQKSIVVHLSEDGALLILNAEGLIAAKQDGRSWMIYDKDHLISSVAKVMERQISEGPLAENEDPYCVACSLFQILFDISMKRHGGLIILDQPENLSKYVVKGIERDIRSPLNRIFTHSPFNGLEFSIPEVRKLVELSSVDGALILDLQGNLVQVGSMVVSHPTAVSHFGTREAAGFSAARFGATSFKISADGQVTLFFTTPLKTGDEVHQFNLL